jgi:hypothetical protein
MQSQMIQGYISKRMAGVQPHRWSGLATKAADLTRCGEERCMDTVDL